MRKELEREKTEKAAKKKVHGKARVQEFVAKKQENLAVIEEQDDNKEKNVTKDLQKEESIPKKRLRI